MAFSLSLAEVCLSACVWFCDIIKKALHSLRGGMMTFCHDLWQTVCCRWTLLHCWISGNCSWGIRPQPPPLSPSSDWNNTHINKAVRRRMREGENRVERSVCVIMWNRVKMWEQLRMSRCCAENTKNDSVFNELCFLKTPPSLDHLLRFHQAGDHVGAVCGLGRAHGGGLCEEACSIPRAGGTVQRPRLTGSLRANWSGICWALSL